MFVVGLKCIFKNQDSFSLTLTKFILLCLKFSTYFHIQSHCIFRSTFSVAWNAKCLHIALVVEHAVTLVFKV